MTGCLVEGDVRDVWCPYAVVAASFMEVPEVVFDFFSDNHAVWLEEWESCADEVCNGEEIEFFTELAVVALFGFFKHGKVCVEGFFCFKRKAVDTSKHGVVFFAAPVGAGHLFELKRINWDFFCRMFAVAATAEVGKTTAGVEGNWFVTRSDFFDEFEFVFVVRKNISRFLEGNLLMREFLPLGEKISHHGFDAGKVCVTWCFFARRKIDVIVETVFDCRAKRNFRFWILFKDCRSEEVCQCVA